MLEAIARTAARYRGDPIPAELPLSLLTPALLAANIIEACRPESAYPAGFSCFGAMGLRISIYVRWSGVGGYVESQNSFGMFILTSGETPRLVKERPLLAALRRLLRIL